MYLQKDSHGKNIINGACQDLAIKCSVESVMYPPSSLAFGVLQCVGMPARLRDDAPMPIRDSSAL